MSANDEQVGGTHYKDMGIQPWDFMRECMSAEAFSGYLQGCCIKYLSRFQRKGGIEDLRKARHYLDKLIETKEVMQIDRGHDSSERTVTTPAVSASAAGNDYQYDCSKVGKTDVNQHCPCCGKWGHIPSNWPSAEWPGPDWSQAPEWAYCWAINVYGNAHWFSKEIRLNDDLWQSADGYGCFHVAPSFNYHGHWRDSLRRRPTPAA